MFGEQNEPLLAGEGRARIRFYEGYKSPAGLLDSRGKLEVAYSRK